MNRNAIYDALFALASQGEGLPGLASINWPGGNGFQYTSRRVRMFDNLPAKPALCQVDFTETVKKAGQNLPYTWVLGAEWWIFHEGGADADSVPSILSNDILDAVTAALAPPAYRLDNRQTLGDLVYNCYVDGTVTKVSGDIESQALLTVPIVLLVP